METITTGNNEDNHQVKRLDRIKQNEDFAKLNLYYRIFFLFVFQTNKPTRKKHVLIQ